MISAILKRILWTLTLPTPKGRDRVVERGPDLSRRCRDVESQSGTYQSAQPTPDFTLTYNDIHGELRFDLCDLTVCVAVVHEEPDVMKPLASYDHERECFIIRGSMDSKATAEALKRAVKAAHRVISGEILN